MISDQRAQDTVNQIRNIMISERRSPRTVKQYSFLLEVFLEFIKKPLEQCDSSDIEKYKFYLATERNYSKNSQYLAVQALKYAMKVKDIKIPKNLTPPKRSRKMPVYLSENESSRLLRASSKNLRDYNIVNLLLNSGLRVSELCNLKSEDVEFDTGKIMIHGGKGDKERIALVSDKVMESLKSYYKSKLERKVNSPYFFTSNKGSMFHTSTIEKIIRTIAKEAGITRKVTPHTLRHTFATNILKNGGDIRFIQTLLGHSSISTTEIYTHLDSDTMREMYKKFGPKYNEKLK